jgi:hypothetical protein
VSYSNIGLPEEVELSYVGFFAEIGKGKYKDVPVI